MARILTVLALGVLLGAAATLLLRPSAPPLPDLGDLPALPAPTAPPAEAVVTAAARDGGADFYRRLAAADARELAAMIAQAAKEPQSTDRELALAMLLKRHSELDPLGAVRLAREARVGGTGLGVAYGAWARRAPAQALAALSTIESAEAAADVALALIAAFGNDAAAVTRVAAVLAMREGEEPLGITAGPSPVALPMPVSFGGQPSALLLTAQRWAALDARRALAVSRELDDERVRLPLEAAAVRALARVAPDEAFAHFATLGGDGLRVDALGGTLLELARADPERLLAATAGLPPEARRLAEGAALQQLAERDPLAAVRYVERLPMTGERQSLLQTVARSYGKHDPAAALAWARSQPGRENLVAAVLGGLAEEDPSRALDLALELTSPNERIRAAQTIAMIGVRRPGVAEEMANRLLALDDPRLRDTAMVSVASVWATRAPEEAMGWLLANAQDAPPSLFTQIGQQLARLDARNAVAFTGRVPAAVREQWAQGVVQGYAQNDPQGAIDWLAQFNGEPWYGRAAATLAMTVAQRDGAAAARLVDRLGAERTGAQAQQLSSMIATTWANQDPAAAADWALDRPTEAERTTAVTNVVNAWSNANVDAARQWALRLPQGAMRDRALTTILATTANRTSSGLDSSVLNAFASEGTRQQAVLQVVQSLAYGNPARAQTIAETHLTDPGFRAQAERVLDAARNGGPQRPPISLGANDGIYIVPPARTLQR